MSKHRDSYVKVENWGGTWETMPVIEIGDYPLHIDNEDDAEKCAAAINARIDEAVADDRKQRHGIDAGEDVVSIDPITDHVITDHDAGDEHP